MLSRLSILTSWLDMLCERTSAARCLSQMEPIPQTPSVIWMFRPRGTPITRLHRGGVAWLIWGCFVFIGLIGVDGVLVDPQLFGKVSGLVLAAIGFGSAYLVWRAAHIVMYGNGVLVGTAVGPRWVQRGEISSVSLEPDRDLWGRPGRVPVIHLRSGRALKLGAFFARDGLRTSQTVAQAAADVLAAYVRAAP
jgi:hypothetical protein